MKITGPLYAGALAVLLFFFSFISVALAAGVAAGDEGSLLDLAKPVVDAALAGQWPYAAALALVLAAALARRYVAPRWPWLAGDQGSALTVLLGSFGAAVATAITTGAAVSWGLAWAALGVAVTAAGGYSLLKKLVFDPLRARSATWPAWAQAMLGLVGWIFEKPDPVLKSVQAGDAAVKKNPAPGVTGIVGKPRDVP